MSSAALLYIRLCSLVHTACFVSALHVFLVIAYTGVMEELNWISTLVYSLELGNFRGQMDAPTQVVSTSRKNLGWTCSL